MPFTRVQAWAAFESTHLGGSGWVSMGELPAGAELDDLLGERWEGLPR
jgi:hypothetical protein